jgi:hypothetical protein
VLGGMGAGKILSIFNELEIVEQREYTSAMLWNFDEFVT